MWLKRDHFKGEKEEDVQDSPHREENGIYKATGTKGEVSQL